MTYFKDTESSKYKTGPVKPSVRKFFLSGMGMERGWLLIAFLKMWVVSVPIGSCGSCGLVVTLKPLWKPPKA